MPRGFFVVSTSELAERTALFHKEGTAKDDIGSTTLS